MFQIFYDKFAHVADPRNEDAPTQSLPAYKSMSDAFNLDFLPTRRKEKDKDKDKFGIFLILKCKHI